MLPAARMATGAFSRNKHYHAHSGAMEIERTAMALLLTNNEEAKLSKLLVVLRSVGKAKRVGQRCVGQPEELRSEDQITRETPSAPLCEYRIRAMEGGMTDTRMHDELSIAQTPRTCGRWRLPHYAL